MAVRNNMNAVLPLEAANEQVFTSYLELLLRSRTLLFRQVRGGDLMSSIAHFPPSHNTILSPTSRFPLSIRQHKHELPGVPLLFSFHSFPSTRTVKNPRNSGPSTHEEPLERSFFDPTFSKMLSMEDCFATSPGQEEHTLVSHSYFSSFLLYYTPKPDSTYTIDLACRTDYSIALAVFKARFDISFIVLIML